MEKLTTRCYEDRMRPETIHAWLSLYTAVAILAGMCSLLAAVRMGWEIKTGSYRIATSSRKELALALPKLWIRFNLLYLTGLPSILLIAGAYIYYIGIGNFDPGPGQI
ncbi:MAG: hypothetical protein E6Q06_00790 [Candidatus Moraniibacteriota bacterium]|nr:MAG: hypothetical protein E6Q06_00790 [Candidatus Moranbacteria bacterium]